MKRLHDGARLATLFVVGLIGAAPASGNPARRVNNARRTSSIKLRNWYYYNWLSGDQINEQHIHNIDVINWVKNAVPAPAQGQGGREVRKDPRYGEIYDHTAVEFVYADGSRMFSWGRHIPACWNSVTSGAWHEGDGPGRQGRHHLERFGMV